MENDLDSILKRTKQLESDVERLDPAAAKISKAKPPAKAKASDSGDIKEQDLD